MRGVYGYGARRMMNGVHLLKPASAKAKGRNFQKKIKDDLLKLYPELTEDDVRSTSMGAPGEDIQLSSAARKLIPYQIECKAKAKSPTHTIYNQCISHGKHEPLVLIKMDRDIVLAVVSWEHLQTLIKKEQQ